MDCIALILSIISLIATVILSLFEVGSAKKLNDINLEAELSKDIFKMYLVQNIPRAISNLSFNNNQLSNIDELQTALNSFRQELKFYQYFDKDFYKKLKKATQKIEDYIVTNEDKVFDCGEIGEVNQNIITYVNELYSCCKDKYKKG